MNEIRKLKQNGFYTIQSVAYAFPKEITSIDGISDKKAEKIQVSLLDK